VTLLEVPQRTRLPGIRVEAFPDGFYERSTEEVARDLVGAWLLHGSAGGVVVETEAYLGPEDEASHARRSPTSKAGLMSGRPGLAYVYFIYGNHHCLNAVAHLPGKAGAVLIRALEPRLGVAQMRARRPGFSDRFLASGPGRLCQALGIEGSVQGQAFGGGALVLGPAPAGQPGPLGRPCCGPRVGISRARLEPLRFYLEGNPYVSRGPRGMMTTP